MAGSSPRAWGTHGQQGIGIGPARFIPTGVGNTGLFPGCPPGWPVHPHGRGEHSTRPTVPGESTGSSPRAWGTLPAGPDVFLNGRFIPTGVGNTGSSGRWTRCWRVHPHGRGEHLSTLWLSSAAAGSSPRAWGTLSNFLNTNPLLTVHPHGRGEHYKFYYYTNQIIGSSPRAWGTPDAGPD